MIAEIAGHLPPNAMTFGSMMEIGRAEPGLIRAGHLRDRDTFLDVTGRFGLAFAGADPRAVVSHWTLSYFAALIIPAATAALCLDRVLPVGFDDVAIGTDPGGRLLRLAIPNAGVVLPAGNGGRRFETLVDAHLRPFIDTCAAHSGLAARVLWGNAGVILDFIVGEILATGRVVDGSMRDVEALLGRPGRPAAPVGPLSRSLRVFTEGPDRRRRACCLRHRLPGVGRCGAMCPAVDGTLAPC